jgi:oxygen-independent coproporphyrinogen-3 oxidase
MEKIKSVYIHIPFCRSICSYCDFTKRYYNEIEVDKYLEELAKEIKNNYHNEIIETIYVGGGTPSSLTTKQLKKLFNTLKQIKTEKQLEFTFETNIEDINNQKMNLLKQNKVNRLSIGIQTFNQKHLKTLNRKHNNILKQIAIANTYFNNINVDIIYAIPNQTISDLKNDLEILVNLGIKHISTYSLMIEPNTKLFIDNITPIDEAIDAKMYNLITQTLTKAHYQHYEISNFSKKEFQAKHNLNYWNNNHYYGFGLGASGYIDNIRYTNTKSLNHYLNGYHRHHLTKLNKNEVIENELILGFRKLEGINKNDFYHKYKQHLNEYPNIIKEIKKGNLIESETHIYIPQNKIYVSNEILVNLIGENYE